MPEIRAFKGIRYNPEKIEDLSTVICQPYDQISNKMEREYKNKSPYNFVRLVLTKYAEGHDRQREYRDAKRYIDHWLKDKIFVTEQAPAIYPYWQEFTVADKTLIRKGFICLVRLEELGKGNILPHEKTLSKPKADRLNLLRITQKDLEPIFLLYTDPANEVSRVIEEQCTQPPLIELKDEKDVLHKLWRVENQDLIAEVTKKLKDSIFVIADGHHRYETGLNYLKELNPEDKDHPAHFKMITLVNIEDPGLIILPTHRLVKNLDNFSLRAFLEKTENYFEIKKSSKETIIKELQSSNPHTFGFYSAQTCYLLKLKSSKPMEKLLSDRSAEYRNLDVVVLHTLLLENVLGISQGNIENHIRYERSSQRTMRQIENGEFQFAFLMNPTRPEQVKEIAQKKERMPQKSTDFYPKLISGLVFYNIGVE